MSELASGVYLVDGVGFPGRPGTVNVCLLVSADGTATLVDAGFPGVTEPLETTLAEAGVARAALRRIVITHHHPDHTGGIPEIVALTGAEVWAHADDADLIDGTIARKVPAGLPAGAFHGITPAPVDLRLVGGETLGVLGGCRILHTPGHTRGHLSLYLPEVSLLIAGDIVRYENGAISRAPEGFTADTDACEASLRMLAALEFELLLPYHGDYLASGASDQLRRDLGLE